MFLFKAMISFSKNIMQYFKKKDPCDNKNIQKTYMQLSRVLRVQDYNLLKKNCRRAAKQAVRTITEMDRAREVQLGDLKPLDQLLYCKTNLQNIALDGSVPH